MKKINEKINTTKLFYQWKYIEEHIGYLGWWKWKKIIMETFNLATKKEAKYLIKNKEIQQSFFNNKNKKELQEWQIKLDYLEKTIKTNIEISKKNVYVSGHVSTN